MAQPVGLAANISDGKHDDGREGVHLTKIAQGRLLRIPFGGYVSQSGGTSAVSRTGNGVGTNPDRSGTSIAMRADPGSVQGCFIKEVIYGRVVGVRWRRDNNAQNLPFTLIVDGVAHAVKNVAAREHTTVASFSDSECLYVVADDLLDDGPHNVEIHLAGDPAGAVTTQIIFYGWVVEADKGYAERLPRANFPSNPTTVPTTSTAIPTVGAVRKLSFYNSDASNARTVTILQNANVFRVLSVPALGYAEHDFGQPFEMTSPQWNWQVDTGSTVKGFVQQGDVK